MTNNVQSAQPNVSSSNATSIEVWLINKLLNFMGNPPINFELWDGTKIESQTNEKPVTNLQFANRKTLWRLFTNPGLNFGDDYTDGNIKLDGDLVHFVESIYAAENPAHKKSFFEKHIVNRPRKMPRHSVSDAKRNIHEHYDLGNDFYRLWLDKEMQYTCAFFPEPTVSLEQAQLAKMDHVCRKLRLKPGETVIEAGCGWGSFARHMALNYGVKVRSYNISKEQIAYAKERAQKEGYADRVEYVEDDYRNAYGEYDVFVSIGMMEHVGRANFPTLSKVIDSSLSPTGRGLIHTISQNQPKPVNAWMIKRIFPGGYLPTLREITEVLEPIACTVVDVENIRMHYAKTLEHWLKQFDDHHDEVKAMYDDAFIRAWRLYLSASIANFTTNSLQLYQVLFNREAQRDVPWTRAYLYQDQPQDVK